MRRQRLRAYSYLAFFTLLAVLLYIYTTRETIHGKFSLLDSSDVNLRSARPSKLKYILQWTSAKNTPFVYMGVGQKGFIDRNCKHTNCYVTSDKEFFKYHSQFDVIAFAGPEVVYYPEERLPRTRSPHQKYVYANIESAFYYPICRSKLNGYFNWTWTFKLDSDLRWGYIVIRDIRGKIVGPQKEMHWIKHNNMLPVKDGLKKILKGKTKMAAWFVSNCVSASNREGFVNSLNKILGTRYNKTVDIYGVCGDLKCPRDNETECFEKLEKDYYFYLSFENAFSKDYVTEKLLNAVQHHALPIVYGGANYSRFLPDGSYINAAKLGPEKLAKKMHRLMTHFEEYVQYFRWTNHYTYHRTSESPETDEYCKMCELLNDEKRVQEVSVYRDLRGWWDPPGVLCYDIGDAFSMNLRM